MERSIELCNNPTFNFSLVRYESYCNYKPHGTSKPNFPSPKGYLPSITSIRKNIIVTHNFTNDDLTNGKSPSYQSLVNIPPAQLRSPLLPVTEETPVPATRTLPSMTVFPFKPAPFSFSAKKHALPACYLRNINHRSKVGV